MEVVCENPRCSKLKEENWHLLCPECWKLLDSGLQEKLYKEHLKDDGSFEHQQVIDQCISFLQGRS